jgi:hypothetical protein
MSRFERRTSRSQPQNVQSHITAGHVRAFQAVRSQLYDNITLTSCTIDGEGGVAIVMVDRINDAQMAVMPLFVAITSKMVIEFEGEAGEETDSRAPSRYDVLREQAKPSPNGAD